MAPPGAGRLSRELRGVPDMGTVHREVPKEGRCSVPTGMMPRELAALSSPGRRYGRQAGAAPRTEKPLW